MGGPLMKAAGVEVIKDVTAQAVVGIFEAAKRYPFFKRIFDHLLKECGERRPAAVIGIDFPGFNLRFESSARKLLGEKALIAQYVSPQLWAWNEGRKSKMAKYLDLVLCIFPFEPAVYKSTRLRAEYVGHPLALKIETADPRSRDPNLVALLPGSRDREIKFHWPVFRETARRLQASRPDLRFAVGNNAGKKLGEFPTENPDRLMRTARAGLVASGTATLEACLHGLPFLAVYKVFEPTFWLGKAIIKIPHLAMPNVIAGRQIVPEFIQKRCRAEELAPALGKLLDSAEERGQMQAAFQEVRAKLGSKDAAANAAALILEGIAARNG
jgi:lipid-A-disaccharide synthase